MTSPSDNSRGADKVSRNVLPYREKVRLGVLVEAEYAKFGGSDDKFAVYASEKLGTPITGSHVASCRKAFDIEAGGQGNAQGLWAEVAALRRRIETLEKRFDVWDGGATR